MERGLSFLQRDMRYKLLDNQTQLLMQRGNYCYDK